MLALISAMAVVSITSSLNWPILAEALRNQGYSEMMIGINAAAQFLGIIIIAIGAPRIIPKLGFFKAILLGLIIVGLAMSTLPLFRQYEIWLFIRLILGMGNALLFTAGDTWINQIVDDKVRGRWMGIYVTASMAGWAVGPIIGANVDPDTYWPFFWGLIAIALAAAVLMGTRNIDIRITANKTSILRDLTTVFILAPTILLTSAMFGVLEGAVQSFAHLYTMDTLGDNFRQVGYAVISVGAVAAIFLQYPVGVLADRVNRIWLLIYSILAFMVCMILLPLLIQSATQNWWAPEALIFWIIISAWGGSMGAIFTVGITLVGERFHNADLIAANAVYSILFGLGGLLGPFIAGTAMSFIGPIGFPLSLLAVASLYFIFAIYKQLNR